MKIRIEQLIRAKLKERNISISGFAREIGVTRVTLYNFFAGRYSRKLLQKISKALLIPVSVLMSVEEGSAASFDHQLVSAYHSSSAKIQRVVSNLLDLDSKSASKDEKPIVLVVDDLQDNVELLMRCLRKEFDVRMFTDPLEALNEARIQNIAAIITDQRMPAMTGTELLHEINSFGRPIVKIIVSAYCDNEALLAAINDSKPDAFVLKPFEPAQLRDQLRSTLERSRGLPTNLN